jgi:hypothetical protein
VDAIKAQIIIPITVTMVVVVVIADIPTNKTQFIQ